MKVSASEINAELTRSYTLIQDIFKEFELQELMPTTEQLKDVYTSRTKVEDPKGEELVHQKTFWEIYDEFTEENGKLNDWTKATFEKFAAQRNHLHDFNPNISFDDFTEEGLNDYMDFLGHKLEMRNSTISKISAYNFCEQYEKEHPSAKVDFALYADKLEQTNEMQSSSNNELSQNYIINVGRIEGVRFYLKGMFYKLTC